VGSLDDSELKVCRLWASQLNVPVTVVVDLEAEQSNVEVSTCCKIVSADVGEDSTERHTRAEKVECDA